MLRRDCEPMASAMWDLLEGSTWKVSAMQEVAISMLSLSSGVRVPSLREVERKSMMARARRFLLSRVDAWWVSIDEMMKRVESYHDGAERVCVVQVMR